MTSSDRREFQRLRLGKPILALLDGQNALILDIGLSGAYVEHYGKRTAADQAALMFWWKGTPIEFVCDIVHSDVVRQAANDVVSQSGLRFAEPIGDAIVRLNDMVATFIGKLLAAQKANAGASEPADSLALIDLGGARRARAREFIQYRLTSNGWARKYTDSPQQPDDGFTVAGYEDEEDLRTLCATYAAADDEGRRLIRLVAELSAKTVKR